MRTCPLCSLEIDDTDLTRFYLSNPDLISFIKETHKTWQLEMGACSQCLETQFRNWNSQQKKVQTEEKTLVSHNEGMVGEEAETRKETCLITIHGSDLGKKYTLEEGTSILGRGESAQVRINEENVSRQHAKIEKDGSESTLIDLDSTNGTFVNTRKITSTVLRDGDLILIGNTILKFMSGSNVENQYHEEIYRLATIDGLTQLYNRSFFLDKLTDEFSRSKRYHRDVSLILLDFDHFKVINDTHGHPGGDELLKKAASLIVRNMRKEDICGRYGGEEFGILLPETPLAIAVRLAEKLRKLIEKTEFRADEKSIKATICAGVASLSKEMKNPNQLIEQADQALYRAKKSGRNCVRT